VTHVALGSGEEFDFIRGLVARWGERARGIGDDAAILSLGRGDRLLASVDAAVEGTHFRADWMSPREIGYRAVAAALSDLAAMAARPAGVLIALGLPPAWRERMADLADGIADAVTAADTVVRGGNVSAASELSITTTVLGTAFSPLTRDAARAGDCVYVTGVLGAPGAALRRASLGEAMGEYRARFVHPVPRLLESRWLAERGAAAAIDVSDGLAADVGHLAAASGVAVAIERARIRCVPGVLADDALISGEEYELVVAARSPLDTDAFERRFELPLTQIGNVIDGPAGAVLIDGQRVANAGGHDHLSR
jgi:thiamine-monophosphate kinase